jgi:hypothetical protein
VAPFGAWCGWRRAGAATVAYLALACCRPRTFCLVRGEPLAGRSRFVGREARPGRGSRTGERGRAGTGAITTGPDGNLWFTVPYSDEVGRLTPSGHATLFRIATNCYPGEIGPGAGVLWVTCQNLSLVYRISTNGAITPITVPHNGNLGGIAQAPNGAMWFTDLAHGLLARITGS